MNRIDKLLDLYFNGQSSLKQEKELRTYFLSSKLRPEHIRYKPLFTFIEGDSLEINKKKIKFRYLITLSSVAACVLIFLTTLVVQKSFVNDYKLLINGKNVKNKELALNLAKEKINFFNEKIDHVSKQTKKIEELLTKGKNIEITD